MASSLWDECLPFLGDALLSSPGSEYNSNNEAQTSLRMIMMGPGLIRRRHAAHSPVLPKVSPFGCVHVTPYDHKYHCFLHEYTSNNNSNTPEGPAELLSRQDVVCLFNPGIGYDMPITHTMKTQSMNTWIPSLKLLLLSKKPLLITSI